MHGGHQHVLHGQPRGLVNQLLGLIKDAATDHATVCRHDGDLRLPIVEHHAAGMQLVMNEGRLAILKAAIDGTAKLWRDVARRCSRPKLSGLCGRNDEDGEGNGRPVHASHTAWNAGI